ASSSVDDTGRRRLALGFCPRPIRRRIRLDFLARSPDIGANRAIETGSTRAMTDTPARASNAAPEEQPDTRSPARDPGAAAPAVDGGPGESKAADPVAALAHEAAALKDRLLRSLAEMENLRRRTEKEVADARQYGIVGFARDLVAVADNMRRALEAVGAPHGQRAAAPLKTRSDRVEVTERA